MKVPWIMFLMLISMLIFIVLVLFLYISLPEQTKGFDFTFEPILSKTKLSPELIRSTILVRENKVSNISCMPQFYGYDASQDGKIFGTYYEAKECNFNIKDYFISDNNELIPQCGKNEIPSLVVGYDRKHEKFGNFEILFDLVDAEELKKTEYGLMKCGKNSEIFHLQNKYNNIFAELSSRKTNSLREKFRVSERKKPLSVVLLVIDSVSREGFFRNMPETVKFFNNYIANNQSMYSQNFSVYDFLFSSAIEPFTMANMIPILFGKSVQTMQNIVQNRSIDDPESEFFFKVQEEKAIWNYFRKKGFVTMFNFETVHDYLSKFTGRHLNTDHIVSNFWHLAKNYAKYNDFAERADFCIGNFRSQYYSLNYLSDYLKNYKGLNRFAYTHLSISHERTGKRLKTADNEVMNFFKDIIKFYSKINEDVVFLFMSDHGRDKTSPVSLQEHAEKLWPFTFILTSKSLISEFASADYLLLNTNRLVSRYDLHKTLLFLANSPYLNSNNLEFFNFENFDTEIPAVNLFTEEISAERQCQDAGISEKKCLCLGFYDISTENWDKNYALNYIIKTSINNINEMNSDPKRKKKFLTCPKLELKKVTRIQEFLYDKNDDFAPIHYKVEIELTNNATIEVHGTTASAERYVTAMPKGMQRDYIQTLERYKFFSKDGRQTNALVKIWEIKRLDLQTDDLGSSFCEE